MAWTPSSSQSRSTVTWDIIKTLELNYRHWYYISSLVKYSALCFNIRCSALHALTPEWFSFLGPSKSLMLQLRRNPCPCTRSNLFFSLSWFVWCSCLPEQQIRGFHSSSESAEHHQAHWIFRHPLLLHIYIKLQTSYISFFRNKFCVSIKFKVRAYKELSKNMMGMGCQGNRWFSPLKCIISFWLSVQLTLKFTIKYDDVLILPSLSEKNNLSYQISAQ